MEKPKKPNADQIRARAEKRKHILITVVKGIKSGSLDDVAAQAMAFAQENEVAVSEVKFQNSYYGRTTLKIRRRENDKERLKRVKEEIEGNYNSKLWEYQRWERQENMRKQEEERRQLMAAGKCIHCGK